MTICVRCKEDKATAEFKWRTSGSGQSCYCVGCKKEINREHYQKNKEVTKARSKDRSHRIKLVLMQFVYDYLNSHPCVDCGEADPIVLEFDHRGDKKFDISTKLYCGTSLETLKMEIEKCDVRCANCHRRRHAICANQWKYALSLVREQG